MKVTPLWLLLIVFVVLKLTNVIAWGWFWVLSPILIPALAIVIILIVMGILATIGIALNK